MVMTTDLIEFTPGIYYDMPAEHYHAIRALSKSTSASILRSPAHYIASLNKEESAEQTKSRLLGSALHCAVLEPDLYVDQYVAIPKIDKRTKVGKQAWADFQSENEGKTLLQPDELASVSGCAAAMRKHRQVRKLLVDSKREVSLFWRDPITDIPCKARLDILSPLGIGDPKTTDDASATTFRLQASRLKYYAQDAWYRRAVFATLGEQLPFFFIAGELSAPHGVMVYEMESAAVEAGQRYMDRAVEAYAAMCEDGGPDLACYDDSEPAILTLPNYIYN